MTFPPAPTACAESGCREYAASRRGVLRGLALGGIATMVGTTVVTVTGAPADAADATGNDAVLVVISLRGAADGLSLVVPHGDPAYYAARPRIGVPREQLLAQDPMFGLHPALAPLLPLWEAGEMAAVHATGLPVANRSHFAAMEAVEEAQPGSSDRTGWLNRLVGQAAELDPAAAITVGTANTPISMRGSNPPMSMFSVETVKVAGESSADVRNSRRHTIERLWGSNTTAMGRAVGGALKAADSFAAAAASPDNGPSYPAGDLGRALSNVARTIRGGVGARVVTIDTGGWDTHTNVGSPQNGKIADLATDLAGSLAAFFTDLGAARDHVTVVTISEFGRRVQENASRGLDHGWGNVMFVAGAGVRGGRYYGRWPGLVNGDDADLAVTTDYRSVLADIVASRFPTASMPTVFPGFHAEPVNLMAVS